MQTGNYDDRFFSRALSSKDPNSAANSSFRVYYGGATGSIPFRWESRPGTPKHAFSQTSIPPLTPPPSYYSSSHSNSKPSSKSTLFGSIFPRRLAPRKSRTPSSSFSSSSSSSSSWSSSHSSSFSSSSPFVVRPKFLKRRRRRCLSESGEEAAEESASNNCPTSSLCYGGWSSRGSLVKGCYQLVSVKNALLSIVGVRSAASRGTLT